VSEMRRQRFSRFAKLSDHSFAISNFHDPLHKRRFLLQFASFRF
jgi:hypothetical protein